MTPQPYRLLTSCLTCHDRGTITLRTGATIPCPECEQAVSSVVGVVMMVGVTVVLAAIVFVLATNFSGTDTATSPTVTFTTDDIMDRLVVANAAAGADWSRLSIHVTTQAGATPIMMGAATPYNNEPAGAGGADVTAATVPVTVTSTPIRAGDYLDFCGQDARNIELQVTDTVTNTVVGTYRFASLGGC